MIEKFLFIAIVIFIAQFGIGSACLAVQMSGLLGKEWTPFPALLIVEFSICAVVILLGFAVFTKHMWCDVFKTPKEQS